MISRLSDWLYFFGFLPAITWFPKPLRQGLARWRAGRFQRSREESARLTREHLQQCLEGVGRREAARLAALNFQAKLAEELDAFRYRKITPGSVRRIFEFEGLENLERLRAEGRGAVLITGHVGSICSAVIALGQAGFPIFPLAHDSRADASMGPALNAFSRYKLRRIDRKCGGRTLFVDLKGAAGRKDEGILEVLQALRKGGMISMPLDIPPHFVENTAEAEFLGLRCRFPSGAPRLARLAGAPVVPYFILRDPQDWNRQKVMVQHPVELSGDVEVDLQRCADRLEAVVKEHPEQWFAWDSLDQFLTETADCGAR